MVNKNFEVYKLKRELKRSGVDYEFTRQKVNDFGEPTGDDKSVRILRGLYHERNEHIAVTMSDTTQVRTKKVPSILCLYEDAASLALVIGDKIKLNGKEMKVTGVVNIQEWNLIADVSLEVVDSGT